jgi:hypothetical protein
VRRVEATDTLERATSPTAANASNRLFKSSGQVKYLVLLGTSGGGAQKGTNVTASSGDEAAEMALRSNPGFKVMYVGPAGDAPPTIDVVTE